MPNKDSFTFSDKLKKSKSLPLSKRIPSKVGGDGKAKRTLIQRAQRDLPFIIVAAAALLLLPILSRNGGTDDLVTEPSMDFVGSPDSTSTTGGLGQEIAPSSGFKNPLDYIITRSGTDSEGVRNGVDTGEEGAGYEATTSPYTSEKEERATETYAPAAKAAVRNATERKATQVNALRNSKTIAASGGTGVSRTLAVGSATKAASGTSINPGVRPVALQPMTSAGKGGRSETGEGLYAEAARSVNALNRGSSKQALFDAQLKNVDGSALGSIGGGPNFGSGGKVGSGGAPSNSVGYKPYLPWWWDFEKQKAMKRWELWDYNFQKALSDNIIKVGTSLALCLTTGSAEGKVDKFLGEKSGAPDYICDGAEDTVMSWGDYRDNAPKTESGSGDNAESRTSASYEAWITECKAAGGHKKVSPDSSKNMLDVRLRCLGLKYKNIKWLKKTTYELDCAGVGADPMSFKITASRSKHLGHYVLAKQGKEGQERIIYVGSGAELDGEALKKVMEGLPDYDVTKVVGFKARGGKMSTGKTDKYKAEVERLVSLKELEKAKEFPKKVTTTGSKGATTTVTITTEEQYQAALKKAQDKMSKEKGEVSNAGDDVNDPNYESSLTLFKNMVEKSNKEGGSPVYEGYAQDKFSVINSCPVNKNFLDTKVSDAKVSPTAGVSVRDTASFVKCAPTSPASTNLNPGADYVFASHITKPAKNVYAIFIESVQGTNGFIVKKVENVAGREGYSDEAGNYFMDVKVGIATTDATDKSVSASVPGTGMVYWITTSNGSKPKVSPYLGTNKDGMKEGVNYFPNSSITVSDLVDVYGGEKHAVCEYRWNCNAKLCPANIGTSAGEYCAKNGNLFSAFKEGNKFIRTTETAATKVISIVKSKAEAKDAPEALKTWLAKGEFDEDCDKCVKEAVTAYAAAGYSCTDICAKLQEKIVVAAKAGGMASEDKIGDLDAVLEKLGLKETDLSWKDSDESSGTSSAKALCPVCKEKKPVQAQPRLNDPCNIVIGDNFNTGVFSSMNNPSSFNDNIGIFYSNCLKANSDGSPRTGNVNVWIIGNTDLQGESKVDTCEVNGSTLGAKNVALSEARAITAARGLATEIAKLDYKNGSGGKNMKIVFNFNSVGRAGFNPATKTFIDSFNRSGQVKTPVSLGSVVKGDTIVTYDKEPAEVRTITVNVVGQGSLEMLKAKGGIPKTKAERDDATYRYIRVTDKNSGNTVALIDQAANRIDELLTQECQKS